MSNKPEDRRIRRTKKLLRQGLAELMNEKDFKDITVKEITDRVDLNRGTFYLHYRDTYDLLEKVENELIETFESLIENYHPTEENSSAFVIINQVYDYITENLDICKILFFNNSSSHYENKLLSIISSKGFEINSRLFTGKDSKLAEYTSFFMACGMLGLVKKWLSEDMPIPKDTMVGMMDRIISNAFHLSLLQQ